MNGFLQACGATGPLTLGVGRAGATPDEVRVFDQPFVLVGRDPRCDLRLDHPEVSERHAYLQVVGGRLVCLDLGSRTGVYHGGRCRRLADVDRAGTLRIGPFRLRLLSGDDAGAAPPPEPAHRHALDVAHRGLRQTRADLSPGLALVGHAADCALRLIDPSVSGYHASLVNTPEGVWVVDLLGQGGVRVNGQGVTFARLDEGDRVELGQSFVRLGPAGERPDTEAVAQAPPPEVLRPTKPIPAPVVALPAYAPVGPGAPAEPAALAQAAGIVEAVLAPLVQQVGMLQQQMADDFHQARASMFETFAAMHQEQSAFLSRELDELRQLSQDLHALRDDLEKQTRLLGERLAAAAPPAPALPAAVPARVVPPAAEAPRRPVHAGHGPDESIHSQLCDRIARLQQEQQTRWQRLLGLIPAGLQGKPGV